MKAGHFSAKIPGQLSAEINNLVMKKWEIEAIKLDEPGINLTTTRPLTATKQ